MSLPVDDVLAILRDHLTDASILNAVAKDLIQAEKEVKEEKAADKGPKSKTRFAIVIQGDDALKALVAGGAYVLSVPDDDLVGNTYMGEGLVGRIKTAARAHNDAPRKRRSKSRKTIKTIHDAMTSLKSKVVKESGSSFSIKGKGMPCEVIVVKADLL